MTGCAPQLAPALTHAPAQRQLLHLGDSLDLLIVFSKQVGNRGTFEFLARVIVLPRLAGVEQPGLAFQMALLADAVTSAPR